jgi:predicted nucleic acid-binding protein
VILVDTTPLVALCDPRDALHGKARADLDRIGRRALHTCTAVLVEACFLLEHSVQRERLRRLIDALAIRSFAVEDELGAWSRVFAWLSKYADHEPDWADGYLAIACSLERRARLWTYDAEFRTIWRREDGSRIPLVAR